MTSKAGIINVFDNVTPTSVVIQETPLILNVMGNPGPQGPSGAGGIYYRHNQAVALDTWTINHNLGTEPNISVFSVGGREMIGEILHVSINITQVYFDAPVAGYAICS